MKTKLFSTILFVVVFQTAQSQNEKSGIWLEREYRNELSIDISPAIRWAIAPYDGAESIGITYRKFFNSSHAFRLGYRSSFDSYNYYKSDNSYLRYQFVTPDSIQLEFSLATEFYKWRLHTLKTGYEYRVGKRRIKGIFGIDLLNGIQTNQYTISSETLYSQTVLADTSGTGWTLYADTSFFNFNDFGYKQTSYVIGFTPSIGLNINFNKRWAITASVYYDFYWNIPLNTKTYPFSFPTRELRGINISTEAIFGDVSLTYNFGKRKSK